MALPFSLPINSLQASYFDQIPPSTGV